MKVANVDSRSAHAEQRNLFDRALRKLSAIGVICLAFLLGMIGAIGEVPPYRSIRDAYAAVGAWQKQRSLMASKWPAYLWNQARHPVPREAVYDLSRATAGYTVFSSGHDGDVRLIDMEGNTVHRWNIAYSEVWPDDRNAPAWIPDHFIYAHRIKIFPNGDLLACFQTTVQTPYGCGLAKVDKSGKTIWTYEGNAHHEFSIGSDGRVYVLTQQLRRSAEDDLRLDKPTGAPLIEDRLAILSVDGKELKSFSILDAVLRSPYFRKLACHIPSSGDVLHSNSVSVIDEGFAAHHQGISAGDLMVSLRNLNLLVVINPDSESIVWATTGPWNHPHDPDPLANGNIMIFDNIVARGTKCGSAVIEFDPRRRQIAWSYQGSDQAPLRSDIRSCQQLLENGDVLITESDQGRIVEVTRDGEIVWEYLTPIRGGETGDLVPIVCGAERFRYEDLPFLKELGILPPTNGSITESQAVTLR